MRVVLRYGGSAVDAARHRNRCTPARTTVICQPARCRMEPRANIGRKPCAAEAACLGRPALSPDAWPRGPASTAGPEVGQTPAERESVRALRSCGCVAQTRLPAKSTRCPEDFKRSPKHRRGRTRAGTRGAPIHGRARIGKALRSDHEEPLWSKITKRIGPAPCRAGGS